MPVRTRSDPHAPHALAMTTRMLRTLREAVLMPASAAALPWSSGYTLLKHYANDESLFGEAADAGCSGAGIVVDTGDAAARAQWKWRHRLVRLIDHCDMFLVRTRSRRWLGRNVDVSGAWPVSGPFIAMTFHWGAGLWSLAHLRAQGHRARFLSARIDKPEFVGDAVAHAYARARNSTVEAAGGAPVIYTGGATTAIENALRDGHVVVALYDVPADDSRATVQTTVCNRSIHLPAGLARLAARNGVAVVPFSMGVDYDTGRRRLRIEDAFVPATPQAFADRLGVTLTRLIREDSAAWHFSAFAPQFFGDSAAVRGQQPESFVETLKTAPSTIR